MKSRLVILLAVVFVGLQLPLHAQTMANTTGKGNVVYVPFDFTVAAEKAKESVVYIEVSSDPVAQRKRQENNGGTRRRAPQDLEDFFSFDLFKNFQFDIPKEGKGSGVILSLIHI